MRRRDLVGVVAALAMAALFVRLGSWQLHRLHERRARNDAIRAARAQAPVTLPLRRTEAEALRDRRVLARGAYDYIHERVWRGRTFQGTPGVALLTPLRLADGSAVFVDRGWVPSADAWHVDPAAWREADSASVTGLAFPAPRGRGDVNPVALQDSLPYSLLPVVILLDDTTAPHPAGLRRWPMPTLGDGSHLSYAIQWFSFAVIVVVGTVALLRRTVTASS